MSPIWKIDAFSMYMAFVEFIFDFSNAAMRWEKVEESFVFKASLPSTKMEDIDVEVDDEVLVITKELNIEVGSVILKRLCKISRTFELPDGLKREDFRSITMEDGVLTVTFTKGSLTVLKKVIAFLNAQTQWSRFQNKIEFKAYFPAGVLNSEDLKIEIEAHDKEIKLIKNLEIGEQNTWLREEFNDDKISRSFKLPKDVKLDGFKTAMEDGVLTVTFTQLKLKEKLSSMMFRVLTKLNRRSGSRQLLSTFIHKHT